MLVQASVMFQATYMETNNAHPVAGAEQTRGTFTDGREVYEVRTARVAKSSVLRVYCDERLALTITDVDGSPTAAWQQPWRGLAEDWKSRVLFESYRVYYGCDSGDSERRAAATKEVRR
jgi:hypothetical protein